MTEQDKDILIGKMLDSPSSLTDEELNMILTDDELKDIYKVSASVKGAYMCKMEMDVEYEWRLFRHRIMPKQLPMRWMMRVAAIFLGVVLLSGIIVKIVDHSFKTVEKPFVVDSGQSVDKNNQAVGSDVKDHTLTDGEKISEISVSVAGEGTIVAKPVMRKKLRSNAKKEAVEGKEIDVDEYLCRQQAEIDREIALLNAEMYLDEQYAICEFMGFMNEDNMGEAESNIIIQ